LTPSGKEMTNEKARGRVSRETAARSVSECERVTGCCRQGSKTGAVVVGDGVVVGVVDGDEGGEREEAEEVSKS